MKNRIRTKINIRPVKYEQDKVYWAELAPSITTDLHTTIKYIVHSGYYLASYLMIDTLIHIVSLGDVTSCVVRHLREDEIFYSEAEAQKHADELNKRDDRITYSVE